MTARACAAISMQSTIADHREARDQVSENLVRFVAASGFVPLLVPNCEELATELVERASLLVLSGGSEPVPRNGLVHSCRRQKTEYALIEAALERGRPIFGLCRGAQALNGYFGGSVRPLPRGHGHVATEHEVILQPSRLAKLLGCGSRLVVNSFHNDGVGTLGEGLRPVANSPDGEIEAFEHFDLAVAGVMWHPERGCTGAGFVPSHALLLKRFMCASGATA